jgi:hypothetical protein
MSSLKKMESVREQPKPGVKKTKAKKRWIIVASIVAALILLRLCLPYLILNYVNKKLAGLKEYHGHVEDIDLVLIRGAYRIHDIRIEKKDRLTQQVDSLPFFTAPGIDLSVEWRALFKGAIAGEIYVEEPELNFVKGKHQNENVKQDTTDFRQLIKDLMPLTINHFEIHNGRMRYVDPYSTPMVNVGLTDIEVKADNLSNVNDSNTVLPARLQASAKVYDGTFNMSVKFDALAKQPAFDLNAELVNLNLVHLNAFFKAYGNFDLKKGSMGFYTEFAAKDGAFEGYVKPLIRDLDIVQWNKEEGDVKQVLWESLIGSVAEIFQNQKKDQLATKIPIRGRFENPDAGLWVAINYVLRNAFVFALRPSIDNTISIGTVEQPREEKKTFLQKIFGGKKKKKKSGR